MQQLPLETTVPHTQPRPSSVLLVYAASGAVGGVVVGLFEPISVVIAALCGAIILPAAEAASWLGRSRWTQGLLFGAVAGGLIAIAAYWVTSPDANLLKLIIAWVIAGIVGGVIFKGFSGTARPVATA